MPKSKLKTKKKGLSKKRQGAYDTLNTVMKPKKKRGY